MNRQIRLLEGLSGGDGIGGPAMLANIVNDSLTAKCHLDIGDLSIYLEQPRKVKGL